MSSQYRSQFFGVDPIAKDFLRQQHFTLRAAKALSKRRLRHSGNYCDKQIKQMIFIRSDCVGYLRITTYFTFYYQIIWIEILRYPSNTNHKKNSWNLQLTLKRKLVKTACYDTHIFIVSHRKHIFSITAHACFVRTKSCFLVFIIN